MKEPEVVTLSRSELYEQVWSKPMTKIAKDYGMSDNGIRKICRKFDIPWPKAGYWQKLEYGKKVKQVPLPDSKGDGEIQITSKENKDKGEAEIPEIVAEYLPKNQIKVPDQLKNPHPLIQSAKQNLRKSWPYRGLLNTNIGEVDIRVGPDSVSRALRIMDALIKALEKRGLEVSIQGEDRKRSTCVKVLNELFVLDIYEHVKMVKKQEKKSGDYENYDYAPSGQLVLRIKNAWGPCRQWKDGKSRKVEDCLNSFIQGLYRVALDEKANRERIEREKETDRERYRQEEALQKQREEEAARLKALENDAGSWHKSRIVRDFIEAKKNEYLKSHGNIEAGSDFEKWLAWANRQVDQLDPLKNFSRS